MTKKLMVSSRKFWTKRTSRFPCRQNLQSKCKQIEINTGSSCNTSQGLPVFCMESVSSLEQAKKLLQPRHRGQAAGNSGRKGQANCCAGKICKVKPKQIETETGSSCNTSQGLPVLRMESVPSLEQAKSHCDQETEDKPIAMQTESAK